jgi:hypothetical protein
MALVNNGFAPRKGGGGGWEQYEVFFTSYRSAAQSYSLQGYLQLMSQASSQVTPVSNQGKFFHQLSFLLAQVLKNRILCISVFKEILLTPPPPPKKKDY